MVARRTALEPAIVAKAQRAAVEFVRAVGFDLKEGPVLLESVSRTMTLPGEDEEETVDGEPLWKIVLSLPVEATSVSSAFLRNATLGLEEPAVERTERTFYLDPENLSVLAMSSGYD